MHIIGNKSKREELLREQLFLVGDVGIEIIKLWEQTVDVSHCQVYDNAYSLEWARNFPHLYQLEEKNLNKSIVSLRHKPETVCVYLLENLPVYVLRRSTKKPTLEWLVTVNTFNQMRYDLNMKHGSYFTSDYKRLKDFRQEVVVDRAKQKEQIEAAWLSDRIERRAAAKRPYEEQLQVLLKQKAVCDHFTFHWLKGHSERSQHNRRLFEEAEKQAVVLSVGFKIN